MKLQQFLLEVKSRDKCEELFGRFLFGEYKKFYKTVKEPDTKTEALVFASLLRWVESAGIRQAVGENLNKLFQCKEKYPKILGQTKDTFYRVVTLPESDKYAKDILEFEYKVFKEEQIAKESVDRKKVKSEPSIRKFWEKNKKEFLKYCNTEFEYKPQYKLESWTNNKSSALNFAKKAMHVPAFRRAHERKGASFIVKANLPKDELLFNPKFMNVVAKDKGWWPQNEVIRLAKGKSNIKTKAFYTPLLKNISLDFEIPMDIKKELMEEIKSCWKEF